MKNLFALLMIIPFVANAANYNSLTNWQPVAHLDSLSVSQGSGAGAAYGFVTNGLVAWWLQPSNNLSGSVLTDYSGNLNTGYATNSPLWVAGYGGKTNAISLDGVNQSVGFPDSSDGRFTFPNTTFTVVISCFSTNYCCLISQEPNTGNNWSVFVSTVGTAQVLTKGGGNSMLAIGSIAITNRFSQVCAVITTSTTSAAANTCYLYVDGSLDTNVVGTIPYSPSSGKNLDFGLRASTFYKSQIENVMIYNRGLSSSEIQTNYLAWHQ